MKPMVASSSRVPGLQSATMCFRHVLDKCKGRKSNVPFVPELFEITCFLIQIKMLIIGTERWLSS